MKREVIFTVVITLFIAPFLTTSICGEPDPNTSTFNPTDDTLVSMEGPDAAYGEREYIAIRNAGDGGIYELAGLVKFDLSSITSDTEVCYQQQMMLVLMTQA